jgi:low temperature requirement protein LtrA
MSEGGTGEGARTGEHAVTPLELFFDIVFVFAIAQVTALLTHDPSWHGVVRGALALAAVWWAWTGYAWLTSTLNVDEGGVRLLVLAGTAAMLGLAHRRLRSDRLPDTPVSDPAPGTRRLNDPS